MTVGTILFAAVIVGTWNGNWFPSHRAEHRAKPEVESRTIVESGRMLAAALQSLDPLGTNDVILCFNEMRNREVATRLMDAIGRTNLVLAAISAYRRRDRFDMQQDVIATTLPVVNGSWAKWLRAKEETPPRGYAQADLLFSPAITGRVYAVHLKSNYGQRTESDRALNRLKRIHAIGELISATKSYKGAVLIVGDMNADKWKAEFAAEEMFPLLDKARFTNALELLPENERATYIGRGKWGDSTLDYIFYRDLSPLSAAKVFSAQGCSDHNPVFITLETLNKIKGTSSR